MNCRAGACRISACRFIVRVIVTLPVLLLGFTGCDSAPQESSAEAMAERVSPELAELLLGELPEGDISSPTDIKDAEGEAVDTILAGRIDAGDLEPFQVGEVAFIVSQLPDEGHGDGDPDHADNCPFCKRKLKNAPKALIQFKDDDGNVLAGDPKTSLSLKKGDVVYVTGSAQYNAAVNTVIVDASGLYRKSAL